MTKTADKSPVNEVFLFVLFIPPFMPQKRQLAGKPFLMERLSNSFVSTKTIL
jgi:hypothetical protein